MFDKNTDSFWAEDAKIEFAVAAERRMKTDSIQKKDLAEKLGTTPAYITKMLRGDANLTIESMSKIARALGGRLNINISQQQNYPVWVADFCCVETPISHGEDWAKFESNRKNNRKIDDEIFA